jgi:hypothetical protein
MCYIKKVKISGYYQFWYNQQDQDDYWKCIYSCISLDHILHSNLNISEICYAFWTEILLLVEVEHLSYPCVNLWINNAYLK